MIQPTSSQLTQAAAPAAQTPQQPAAAPPKAVAKAEDSVNLSSIALAAAKEATETQTQTAKEASKGDNQAKRLLAKEQAAQQITKG